ncbi:MAG TPA: hypothetical protein VE753_10840 [Gaiellaceae bacterium]|nr:hypothetical protein [Gaiellaceae bacterium]
MAGLETLLALHELAAEWVDLHLLAPETHFWYRGRGRDAPRRQGRRTRRGGGVPAGAQRAPPHRDGVRRPAIWAGGGGREAADEPPWWPPAKIFGRRLAPFLAEHAG